jgi:3-hydroxymyristoyl/3-hydroxydecanoyl-(acyl carrier protein) dehydratase
LILFPQAGLAPIPALSTPAAGVSWFSLPVESRCFEGHFDGEPILPAVAHLAMVLIASAQQGPRERVLKGARNLRFSRPLRPGDEVEVVLTAGRESSSVRFEIRCRGELATAGLLLFDSDRDVIGS